MKNGEKKLYSQFFIPAMFLRKALELRKDLNLNNITGEDLDTVINFVVEVFDKQFTAEEVYAGIRYDELMPIVFDGIFMNILQGRKQETDSDEGNGKK